MDFDVFLPDSYDLTDASVEFHTTDRELQRLYSGAEEICRNNIRQFSDYRVLIEGAKYHGVWLETQPMGGEMYCKRDPETALSNILIFLRYQRKDGRLPGMISDQGEWGGICAHYDWLQGCFLPHAALKMYYHIGKNREYLRLLSECLADFYGYLRRYRDSDGDGCPESWCVWDTGEDNCTLHMLHGIAAPVHGAWGRSVPPENMGNMPYASPQIMSYSYACCDVLARIAMVLGDGKEELWRKRATELQKRFREYLWDEEKKYCFPRDKYGDPIRALTQENIKCMYSGIFTQDMADDFIRMHLLNENEFLTPYPIPSIAANDAYFYVDPECANCAEELIDTGMMPHDMEDNNWSGASQGLTLQRSVDALLHYHHHAESVLFGKKMVEMIKKTGIFVQQYHPFTAKVCRSAENGYGPTTLAFLEYISLLYGINIEYDRVMWTGISSDHSFTYSQNMYGKTYHLHGEDHWIEARIDGKTVFECSADLRVITDLEGKILSVFGVGEQEITAKLRYRNRVTELRIPPNADGFHKIG